MKNDHLTEQTLQAFLLNEMQDDNIAIHLVVCRNCREELEKYQNLIAQITKTTNETFSFDVTKVVMDKIFVYEKKKSAKLAFTFWAILIILLVVIASLSIPFIPKILTIFYSRSFYTTLLVMGTGLVVLLFLLADIYQQYKNKEEKIFKNNLQPIN